jgi:NADP-dependent 3-hydroxy acid dehydrogenase YdfG
MITTSKIALVTGVSSGFGQATAALMMSQSFRVFDTSRAPTIWFKTTDSQVVHDALELGGPAKE